MSSSSSSSNRYTHNNKREGTNSRFPNTKKFVPKTPNLTTPTTLSSSLRQQHYNSAAKATVDDFGKSHRGNFVNYLVQDEAVAAGLGGSDPIESQRVVDLLNTELSKLLKLNPKDFWKQVATDGSLQGFLDSFLQFRSRWFDFPHHSAKGIVAGVIVGEFELSRRVFMVLYRISSNRDPGARASDSLSLNEHGVLLQETKLLDLPKLLDICAIYGHENEVLTRELVSNALKAQPWIHDNITAAMSHFLSIGHTLHQRCISSLEVLFSSGDSGDHNFGKLRADFLEVMDFINDAIVSMDAFVSAYNPAAVFFSYPVDLSFGNEELLITLVRLHDLLLPSLQRGFRIICSAEEDKLQKIDQGNFSELIISLKMLSIRIVRLGCKLLDLCYFSDELFKDGHPLPNLTKMFPATVEDPSIKADILLQTFQEINGVSGILDGHNRGTFLQNAEKTLGIISRFEGLQSIGWISMEAEQFQYLNGILMHSSKPVLKELSAASISAAIGKVQIDDDAVIMESKISQIKELFPDYGNGFLSACLEVYNQNPEDVIQRILEGTLHKDLLSLDTSMENVPPHKASSSGSKNDKGKGKLFDMPPPLSKPVPASAGPTSLSSSSTGRFIRKSKINLPSAESMDSINEHDIARTSALISQYEYEDEYDDSFDDLGLSVGDSGLEETEMNSNLGRSSENSQNPSNTKWNSNNKKPQFFVKDGKNYSYKVQGSVAVANSKEASLLNEAQRDQIHGLGKGGNLPLGAVKRLQEAQKEEQQQEEEQSGVTEDTGGTSNVGNRRGRGGRREGGGRNSYKKDQAFKKHFSGLRGF